MGSCGLTFDISGLPEAGPLDGMVRRHCWRMLGRVALQLFGHLSDESCEFRGHWFRRWGSNAMHASRVPQVVWRPVEAPKCREPTWWRARDGQAFCRGERPECHEIVANLWVL